jgi:6-phosphofructokinase 2
VKIYTLTANPALDLSGHVSGIIPNEKNYVNRARVDPGGNAINAARIIQRLGLKPVILGFAGGASGEHLKSLLDNERLSHRFTAIESLTRTNVTVSNDQDHRQTRLTFPGPKISKSEVSKLLKMIGALKGPGLFVLGGSPPGHCPRDLYARILGKVLSRGLGVVVDVPVGDLKKILASRLEKIFLIKPNQIEFEALVGKKFESEVALAKAAMGFLDRCEIVCISLGAKGALVVWKNQAWRVTPPKVKAKGTVGAGDSMVGAMVTHFAKAKLFRPEFCTNAEPILGAVKWGVAAGAATVLTEGTRLGNATKIKALYFKCKVRKILG